MFSSSSFHGGLVANIFDSCKSSPLSCFAQSGGFLPSHYPSFLRVRVGSGWQGIFIDLDDTLCDTRLLDVCQMLELAQFCWSIITMLKESIDGIVEIEMVLDPVRLWRSGHKPAENCVKIENDTKFGLIPAPAPPLSTNIRPASHNGNKLPRSQHLIQTDTAGEINQLGWSFVSK